MREGDRGPQTYLESAANSSSSVPAHAVQVASFIRDSRSKPRFRLIRVYGSPVCVLNALYSLVPISNAMSSNSPLYRSSVADVVQEALELPVTACSFMSSIMACAPSNPPRTLILVSKTETTKSSSNLTSAFRFHLYDQK